MQIKNIHEKIMTTVNLMLIDFNINLPFYGNFNLFINFQERPDIGTCAVNVTQKGFQFYYSSEFLARLSQKEVNFITLHENFHLLWDHPKRTITGQYDHKLSNIAQDMIINHIIWQDISPKFVEIPKDENGRNMALFVPAEYTGSLIFEELYEWLREEKEKFDKKSSNGDGQSNADSGYGPFGKNPKDPDQKIDTYSLDQILSDLDKNQGQYLDVHLSDEISEDMRESVIKDAMERLQARGLMDGNIDQTLQKLRKQRKDYLKYIKRSVSSMIFGTRKNKTITRPNRRQIFGIKGNRKVKNKINCILDTSGSMGGTFERVLTYIYRNDIEVNLIEADTKVKWVQRIKSKRNLETVPIKGLGGTCLQPAIDYVADNLNSYNTVVLTDGYCDNLDLSRVKGKILMITIGTMVPISQSNGKVKQIKIDVEK